MNEQEENLKRYVEEEEATSRSKTGRNVIEAPAMNIPGMRSEQQVSLGNTIGWQKLPMKDLPTKGMFYPEDAEIAIRSASAGEIRHWSTLNENDPSMLDDMLNYVLERCCAYRTSTKECSWRDIKEVDRFYIILAISEYTFINGENNLQVAISEGKTMKVTKDMVEYVNFGEKLMRYYNPEKRLFSVILKSGQVFDISIPSVGVTNFLKNYVNNKDSRMEAIDRDFIGFAPFVILDWKGLTNASYEKIVMDSNLWNTEKVSSLPYIREMLSESINPVIKYREEGGAERTVPVNFLGGIKSILLISNPFG